MGHEGRQAPRQIAYLSGPFALRMSHGCAAWQFWQLFFVRAGAQNGYASTAAGTKRLPKTPADGRPRRETGPGGRSPLNVTACNEAQKKIADVGTGRSEM